MVIQQRRRDRARSATHGVPGRDVGCCLGLTSIRGTLRLTLAGRRSVIADLRGSAFADAYLALEHIVRLGVLGQVILKLLLIRRARQALSVVRRALESSATTAQPLCCVGILGRLKALIQRELVAGRRGELGLRRLKLSRVNLKNYFLEAESTRILPCSITTVSSMRTPPQSGR